METILPIAILTIIVGVLSYRLWALRIAVDVYLNEAVKAAAKANALEQQVVELMAWREIVRIGSKGIFESAAREMLKKEANKYRGDA